MFRGFIVQSSLFCLKGVPKGMSGLRSGRWFGFWFLGFGVWGLGFGVSRDSRVKI